MRICAAQPVATATFQHMLADAMSLEEAHRSLHKNQWISCRNSIMRGSVKMRWNVCYTTYKIVLNTSQRDIIWKCQYITRYLAIREIIKHFITKFFDIFTTILWKVNKERLPWEICWSRSNTLLGIFSDIFIQDNYIIPAIKKIPNTSLGNLQRASAGASRLGKRRGLKMSRPARWVRADMAGHDVENIGL